MRLVVPSDPISTACRRRLADDQRSRWLWALGSCLPPVLLWHGISRRTALPAVFGLTSLAALAFALATLVGFEPGGSGHDDLVPEQQVPPLVVLGAAAAFALGHKQGQEKAERDGRRWLELDR